MAKDLPKLPSDVNLPERIRRGLALLPPEQAESLRKLALPPEQQEALSKLAWPPEQQEALRKEQQEALRRLVGPDLSELAWSAPADESAVISASPKAPPPAPLVGEPNPKVLRKLKNAPQQIRMYSALREIYPPDGIASDASWKTDAAGLVKIYSKQKGWGAPSRATWGRVRKVLSKNKKRRMSSRQSHAETI